MSELKVYTPGEVKEVLKLLHDKEKVRILAGGTDLLLELIKLKREGCVLIDLSRIEGLEYIEKKDEELEIGSLVTFTDIHDNPVINKYAPALAAASGQVGSVQIRNRATIGGNIAHASPAADSLPVLLAAGARIKVLNAAGAETVLVEEFLHNKDKYRNHLITAILIPVKGDNMIDFFGKVAYRRDVATARINMGVRTVYQPENGKIIKASIFLGALSKTGVRADLVEEYLTGKRVDELERERFFAALRETVDKSIPGRYSQPYKRRAICGLGDDFLQELQREGSYE